MKNEDFDWIFFNCFKTLIDDFDVHGDESDLCSLPANGVASPERGPPERGKAVNC